MMIDVAYPMLRQATANRANYSRRKMRAVWR
jgi:hypothetical protein